MARRAPDNAEQIFLSPDDREVVDFFTIRRSFHKDGSIRYVQVIGKESEIEAFTRNQPVTISDKKENAVTVSLPRMIAQRMLGRLLLPEELVVPDNGKNGDCRRSNLVISNRSEIASAQRQGSWSSAGEKYVYPNGKGRYYLQYRETYLGTYDTSDEAVAALDQYRRMIASGMSEAEAAHRIKSRSRSASRITIEE